MDTARRIGGLLWVGGGLLLVLLAGRPALLTWLVVAAIVALAALVAAALVLGGAPTRSARLVVAWLLALELLGAVADRLGWLGSAGVSWGSWHVFVDYTGRLLPGSAPGLVEAAAVAATAAELVLGALLLAGVWRRWVGKATAGLFAVYLLAMLPTVGIAEVARYAVPVLIGGALLVSVRNGSSAASTSPGASSGRK